MVVGLDHQQRSDGDSRSRWRNHNYSVFFRDKLLYYRQEAIQFATCFLVLAYLAVTSNYFVFKFRLYVRHGRQAVASPWILLVLAFECLYFISFLISTVDNLLPRSRRSKLPPLDVEYGAGDPNEQQCPPPPPMVHVLLTCCSEPTEIQTETICAALALDYPHDRFKVLVLDDGAQDELKAICENFQIEEGGGGGGGGDIDAGSGAHDADNIDQTITPPRRLQYLRRTKLPGVRHHFKCGNLNYGLEHSSESEYVVIVDADMILHPSFLRRMLPYLVNSPNVSFTQIPQCYYNLQVGDLLNSSCIMVYDRMFPHRDSANIATCVGTGAVFRCSHLRSIGGFQPESVSEDTNTSFLLLSKGFESVYVHERLQIGLAPWTLEAFLKQRIRWGRGAIQQVATWNILLGRSSKLNWVQRLLVFWHTFSIITPILNTLMVPLLIVMLGLNLNFSVGSLDENLVLVSYLSVTLITWRILWVVLWVDIATSRTGRSSDRLIDNIQARNREESYFWWISPYMFVMLLKMINWNSSFVFKPTGNVDKQQMETNSRKGGAGAGGNMQDCCRSAGRFTQVKVHLVCVATVIGIVTLRVVLAVKHGDCVEWFRVIGLSLFLLTTTFHLLLPIFFLANSSSHLKPADRKSLLCYDARGVPTFDPESTTGRPQWAWSALVYEALSFTVFAYWVGVLCLSIVMKSHDGSLGWCNMQNSF